MSQSDDLHWQDIQRMESWAGETRVNLIRLLAIAVFYARHLIEVLASPRGSDVRGAFHIQVTCACAVWACAAIAVHVRLRRRQIDAALSCAITLFDAAMITFLCSIGDGPRSILIMLYFPLIAAAPLRLDRRLVYVACAAAVAGYLFILARYAWVQVGFKKYYATPALRIPRAQEAIVILAMLTAGFLAGQIVRQMRRISEGYHVTTLDIPQPDPRQT